MKHKLVYIADIRLPTEKAHGIQIMEMCSAFADLGELLGCPPRSLETALVEYRKRRA
jgi:hypothetical protein